MTQDPAKEIEALRKQIFLHQILTFILLVSVIASFTLMPPYLRKGRTKNSPLAEEGIRGVTILPYYKEISSIISPLTYSGMKILMRANAKLSIDFVNKTWTIENYHRYGSDKRILLEDDRYGLCGQLASHVFDEIKSIFNKGYKIEFVQASQAGYFLLPQSSHYVLSIRDLVNGKQYIIDPSFHRYGEIDSFDDYFFFNSFDKIDPIEKGETNATFRIGVATPLVIVNDYMIDLVVDRYDNKFDVNNFVIAISATRQYKYSGRRIFVLMMKNGMPAKFENRDLGLKFYSPEEYDQLCNRMLYWFRQIVNSTRPSPNS